MMASGAVSVLNPSGDIALTTTLTWVVVSGPGIDVLYINAEDDIYLVLSPTLDTGAVVPTERYRIPAGVCHPVRVFGRRILLAAVTGTTTAWVMAMASVPQSEAKPADLCR